MYSMHVCVCICLCTKLLLLRYMKHNQERWSFRYWLVKRRAVYEVSTICASTDPEPAAEILSWNVNSLFSPQMLIIAELFQPFCLCFHSCICSIYFPSAVLLVTIILGCSIPTLHCKVGLWFGPHLPRVVSDRSHRWSMWWMWKGREASSVAHESGSRQKLANSIVRYPDFLTLILHQFSRLLPVIHDQILPWWSLWANLWKAVLFHMVLMKVNDHHCW